MAVATDLARRIRHDAVGERDAVARLRDRAHAGERARIREHRPQVVHLDLDRRVALALRQRALHRASERRVEERADQSPVHCADAGCSATRPARTRTSPSRRRRPRDACVRCAMIGGGGSSPRISVRRYSRPDIVGMTATPGAGSSHSITRLRMPLVASGCSSPLTRVPPAACRSSDRPVAAPTGCRPVHRSRR